MERLDFTVVELLDVGIVDRGTSRIVDRWWNRIDRWIDRIEETQDVL